MKSNNTTIGGIIQFAIVVLTQVYNNFDADPLTVIGWGTIAASAALLWTAIQSRDHNVSSEEAGIK